MFLNTAFSRFAAFSVAVMATFSTSAFAQSTEQLKSSLVKSANYWTQYLDKDAARVRFVQTYLSDFSKLGSQLTFAEKANLTVGSWREIWSSESNPTPPNLEAVKGQVYQVIRPDGIGFNMGVRRLVTPAGPVTLTAFIQLQAAANFETETTEVEFLKTFGKQGDLSGEPSLSGLVEGILEGTRSDVALQPERRFPAGPVGAKGFLKTVYVDENLRIVQGPNAFSRVTDFFVLERTDVPVALP